MENNILKEYSVYRFILTVKHIMAEHINLSDRFHMGENGSEIINGNEKENSIYFNGSITSRSVSTLIERLLQMEANILKVQRRLNNKIKSMKKDTDAADKMKSGDDDNDDIDNQVEIVVNPKPIRLYITSNGGSVHQVFSAIDTILGMKVPVHTVCKGFVASAGTLLSLAGKRRFITENSYMLIHELRTGSWGKFTEITESFENIGFHLQ